MDPAPGQGGSDDKALLDIPGSHFPVSIVGTMVWMLVFPWDGRLGLLIRIFMTGIGAAACIFYIKRIRFNYLNDKIMFERLKGKPLWYPFWRLP